MPVHYKKKKPGSPAYKKAVREHKAVVRKKKKHKSKRNI